MNGSRPSSTNFAPRSKRPSARWSSAPSMSPKPRSLVPSNTSSAPRGCTWPTRSGKPPWRAGKKGLRRLQHRLLAVPARRQIPLLPGAVLADAARRRATPAGLLLLPALPPRVLPLRRGLGLGRRDQPGAATAGLLGRHAAAVHGCRRGPVAALRQRAFVGIDGVALHPGGRRTLAGPVQGGPDGPAESTGAGLDCAPGGRPAHRLS